MSVFDRSVDRRKLGDRLQQLSAVLKFNCFTFKISDLALIASLLNECQLLKKRICSSWSKFFSLREDSVLLKAFLPREAMKK